MYASSAALTRRVRILARLGRREGPYWAPPLSTPTGMHGRKRGWDYRQRCIYSVVFEVRERRPLLGRLVGEGTAARVEPSALGRAVEACWRQIHVRHPGVSLPGFQLMPDHLHGIIFIQEHQIKPLGSILRGFMVGCTLEARRLGQIAPDASLFEAGFQDTILSGPGQLSTMFAYIRDNPRRAVVKRANRELFKIVRNIESGGIVFAGIGNNFLLDYPVKRVIQCSRSITPEALAAQEAELLQAAAAGAVLVSPCISPGEKRIARAALAAGLPLIVLLENGFAKFYKPPRAYFDACAIGKLLMLAPWPHHDDRRTITRTQCLQLNEMARRIAETGEIGAKYGPSH